LDAVKFSAVVVGLLGLISILCFIGTIEANINLPENIAFLGLGVAGTFISGKVYSTRHQQIE
jgi:hypothetical protein